MINNQKGPAMNLLRGYYKEKKKAQGKTNVRQTIHWENVAMELIKIVTFETLNF